MHLWYELLVYGSIKPYLGASFLKGLGTLGVHCLLSVDLLVHASLYLLLALAFLC